MLDHLQPTNQNAVSKLYAQIISLLWQLPKHTKRYGLIKSNCIVK